MSRRRRDNDAYYWERRGTPTTANVANLDAAQDIQALFYEKAGQAHPEERGASTVDVADLGAISWPALGKSAPVVAVVNGDSEHAAPVVAVVNGDSEHAAPVVTVGDQPEAPAVAVYEASPASLASKREDAATARRIIREATRAPIPNHLRGELSNVDIDSIATTDDYYEIFNILS